MDCVKSWFEVENCRREKILSSPHKLEETLSKRLDADKLIFSPQLNHLQMKPLQTARIPTQFGCSSSASQFTISKHRWPVSGEHSECNARPALFHD